ncbi:hypothetical protein GGX14DRAFT_427096 [Mycena pura]|uniref:Uncharacterized protein n=1 Tax=Mycena pura TaxID=153505 RepID=A0AAD6YLP3_9AGAR|nr:hypothetical protein GGX14DRAFT_427096 [Mycena pura]
MSCAPCPPIWENPIRHYGGRWRPAVDAPSCTRRAREGPRKISAKGAPRQVPCPFVLMASHQPGSEPPSSSPTQRRPRALISTRTQNEDVRPANIRKAAQSAQAPSLYECETEGESEEFPIALIDSSGPHRVFNDMVVRPMESPIKRERQERAQRMKEKRDKELRAKKAQRKRMLDGMRTKRPPPGAEVIDLLSSCEEDVSPVRRPPRKRRRTDRPTQNDHIVVISSASDADASDADDDSPRNSANRQQQHHPRIRARATSVIGIESSTDEERDEDPDAPLPLSDVNEDISMFDAPTLNSTDLPANPSQGGNLVDKESNPLGMANPPAPEDPHEETDPSRIEAGRLFDEAMASLALERNASLSQCLASHEADNTQVCLSPPIVQCLNPPVNSSVHAAPPPSPVPVPAALAPNIQTGELGLVGALSPLLAHSSTISSPVLVPVALTSNIQSPEPELLGISNSPPPPPPVHQSAPPSTSISVAPNTITPPSLPTALPVPSPSPSTCSLSQQMKAEQGILKWDGRSLLAGYVGLADNLFSRVMIQRKAKVQSDSDASGATRGHARLSSSPLLRSPASDATLIATPPMTSAHFNNPSALFKQGTTTSLSPVSDATCGGTPPMSSDCLPDSASGKVVEMADGDDDLSDFGDLQYPATP